MSVFGNFDVRIDPWDIDYGPEFAIDSELDESKEDVDVGVEVAADAWKAISPTVAVPPRLVFVDGVRRMEARLVVRAGDRICHGVFGSFAIGSVIVADGRATWNEEHVHRVVALGSGESFARPIDVAPSLLYEPASAPKGEPDAPLRAIQERMRSEEARHAQRLADTDETIVVADGTLRFSEPTRGRAVGYVKRLMRIYLRGPQLHIVSTMGIAARTPLFALRQAKRRFGRYAWFVRLAEPMGADSPYAGVARLEVSDDVGVEAARRLADATASVLPRFAPSRGRDPRAPQNLCPIGALEGRLRRCLGDARLVRRHIESLVAKETRR